LFLELRESSKLNLLEEAKDKTQENKEDNDDSHTSKKSDAGS
jgi:hypothetical protein